MRRAGRNTVDPTIKNYQWGDLTAASFEAKDRGARTAILMDADNCVAEGPGFNVVIVKDGALASPSRNALPGITRKTVFELADSMGIEATLRDVTSHELYDQGHMYEAAVAHFEATGKRTLLDVAIKSADLVCRTFGPNLRHDVPGHEEVDPALVITLHEIDLQSSHAPLPVEGERFLHLSVGFAIVDPDPHFHVLLGGVLYDIRDIYGSIHLRDISRYRPARVDQHVREAGL